MITSPLMNTDQFTKIDENFEDLTEIMISGFERIESRFDSEDEKFDDLTDIMIKGFDEVYTRFDAKFLEVDRRFDQMDGKLVTIKSDIRGLKSDTTLVVKSLSLIQSHLGIKSDILSA